MNKVKKEMTCSSWLTFTVCLMGLSTGVDDAHQGQSFAESDVFFFLGVYEWSGCKSRLVLVD